METIFIIAVILFAIYWQFYFLKDSIKMINQLKNIFSEKQSYHSTDYYIPANEFGNTSYEEIRYKEAFYTDPSYSSDLDWTDRGKKDKISLVDISSSNPIGLRIESSINNYLIRNKGLASDFSTIKDTVERNCTMLEDEIDTQTPFPLYIGLMCTMLGIIIGIGCIALGDGGFAAFVDKPEQHIGSLMGDVALAMAASFCGIGFTSTISFMAKKSKKCLEERKNTFYSWFQAELMPIISRENASEGVRRLEENLNRFNQTFTRNVSGLNKSVGDIAQTAADQSKLIETVNKLDLKQMATANVEVLKAFKDSIGELDQFHDYLTYANKQLKAMEKRNDAVRDAVVAVDNGVNETLEKLKKSVNEQMQALKLSLANSSDEMSRLVENEKRLVAGQAGKIDAFYDTLRDLKPVIDGLKDWRKELQVQNRELNRLVQTIDAMPRPDGKGGSQVVVRSKANIWQMVIAAALVLLLAVNGFNAWITYHNAPSESQTKSTEQTDKSEDAKQPAAITNTKLPNQGNTLKVTNNPQTPQETAAAN